MLYKNHKVTKITRRSRGDPSHTDHRSQHSTDRSRCNYDEAATWPHADGTRGRLRLPCRIPLGDALPVARISLEERPELAGSPAWESRRAPERNISCV